MKIEKFGILGEIFQTWSWVMRPNPDPDSSLHVSQVKFIINKIQFICGAFST